MSRRSLAALGWLAAVVVATLAGIGAIRLVGDSLASTPGGVRSQAEVARDLAAAPSSSPTRAGTEPASTPTGDFRRETFRLQGGTVVAHCENGLVKIDTWSAAQGFALRDLDEGPDDEAEAKFEGDGVQSEIKLECRSGQPVRKGHDD
ncbi:septum formation initiator [Asanoa sp. NPDC049518]|uniref:septum formation initiator n=1 Tax=unclassified Asanoa TaxID=2685164 RepID=UPI003448461E